MFIYIFIFILFYLYLVLISDLVLFTDSPGRKVFTTIYISLLFEGSLFLHHCYGILTINN